MTCNNCGQQNPEGAPACSACGTALYASAPPAGQAPYGAPGQQPPAGYGQPPAGYGQPPAGYGQPPGAAPYGQPPPGFGPPPGGAPYGMPAGGGYGMPPGGYPGPYGMQPPQTSGLAIAGLILAILCGFIGAIISVVALVQVNGSNGQKTGKGLAIAGIIIGTLRLIIGLAVLAGGGINF